MFDAADRAELFGEFRVPQFHHSIPSVYVYIYIYIWYLEIFIRTYLIIRKLLLLFLEAT